MPVWLDRANAIRRFSVAVAAGPERSGRETRARAFRRLFAKTVDLGRSARLLFAPSRRKKIEVGRIVADVPPIIRGASAFFRFFQVPARWKIDGSSE